MKKIQRLPSMPANTSSVTDATETLTPLSPVPSDAEACLERALSLPPSLELPPTPSLQTAPKTRTPKTRKGGWSVFVSTFVTIFLAELGDKTQVATLLMTAESQSPWIVFAGAGSALVATSLLGVLLGRWLATRISPRTLEKSAAVVLLFVSAMLVWDILH
ncbi:TMEM165/GDT1 family protein [Laspinema olomoucense]|uniref:TMEM165/GDT1 family protein n=1 Tax=Laspinema olomoucense TaxID=3231600 RepID=UPI0021BAA22D|nr:MULTISPECIES: TMEM165/GDT1 family protein [unclassified Laspinema]MCT7987501.1 TMEM165/GDT1 family protein [Laspinema sp. D3a]MCT7993593.1 TMEM165/GDT1 family protein [Laspinema sp. D3c]